MTLTERAAEGVARKSSRRKFLERGMVAFFGAAATFAVRVPRGLGDGPCPNPSETCYCHPPGVGYCDQATQCWGSTCNWNNGCTGWLNGRNGGVYNNGCWCSKTCSGHYYVCCDCVCGNGAYLCMCRGTIYV
jgi:hypothetical protein